MKKLYPQEPVNQPSAQMLRRTLFLMAVCGVFAFAVLLARLFQIQIIQHERFEELAVEQQLRVHKSSARRGGIYDRNMEPLALSKNTQSLYISPAEIENAGENIDDTVEKLCALLDIDCDEVKNRVLAGGYYVTVKKKLSREEADAVRSFKSDSGLHGIRLEPDTMRVYPNSVLACHVLGFVGIDNQGLEGLEAQYDEILTGTGSESARLTDARGMELPFSRYEEYRPGKEGRSLVLTLDSGIQYFAEKRLRQAVRDYDAVNGGGAIVMDVNTGAVLAMASAEGYDPNDFMALSDEVTAEADNISDPDEKKTFLNEARLRQWRNKALCDSYEPGSTFKIITLSMALEEGAVDMDSRFYCGGSVNVKGRTSPIRCWKSGGHGSQSLTEAVQHSCNAAFVNIGLRVGAERFYDYLEAFGFLNKTGDPDENLSGSSGIDLRGETGSIFWSENVFCSERNLSQLAAASFGQTFTISPMQLITAVSACVNGGHLMEPYIVEKELDPDGSVYSEHEPKELRQVISAESSARVRDILEKVVGDPKDGTGRNAAVSGYRIGGKTGTSEKVSLEAATGKKEYIVSFVGFAPADDPKVAVLVFLDTPTDKSGVYISGGQMAAPVVGRLLADILPCIGLEPELSPGHESRVPQLRGLSLDSAQESIGKASLRYRTVGEGDKVTAQLPDAGSVIAEGTEILLYLSGSPENEKSTVPELRGMDYETARDTLSERGLFVRSLSPVYGSGMKISGQNLPPGTLLPAGSVIELTLEYSGEQMLGKY